jgi:MtN3 and saliva related transmembrane protein
MDAATVVGSLATLASTTSFAPQAWKIVKTRDTGAISTGMYAVTVVGLVLWLAYGLLRREWPLIATNGVCLVLSAFILLMKLLPCPKREAVAVVLNPGARTAEGEPSRR